MTEQLEVALFPIPNVVAFPNTVVPLHVFEPRYRTMIDDSINQGRMIAVCHTQHEISSAKPNQSIQDALKTNQATYSHVPVFSAGECELVEKTGDGRIYVNIHMKERLKFVAETQTLPYKIVACDLLPDSENDSDLSSDLRRDIESMVVALIDGRNDELITTIQSEAWTSLSDEDYSYYLFQFLRFEAEVMQSILECTRTDQRLQMVADVLSAVLERRN